MRRLPVVLGVVAVLVAALLGYAALDVYDRVPGVLTRDRPAASATPTARTQAGPSAVPGPAPSADPPPALVPALGSGAPVPSAEALKRTLQSALHDAHIGGLVGATVRDGATGRHLLDLHADRPLTPASTTKLLTAAAVSATLDLDRTLPTSVVRGSTPHDIVLVAGGDTLLGAGRGNPDAVAGHAGLGDLVEQVARALQAQGIGTVHLRVDDRYADGPAYAPTWPRADIAAGYVGPVTTLGLAGERADDVHAAPRDTAMSVAAAFAKALRRHHVNVSAGITRAPAPRGAARLGRVESAPVGDVLAYALQQSDNALTEELARLAAVKAGRPATFGATAAWVVASLDRLGVDTRGVHLVDSCGLSDGTRIPARVIGDVLGLAVRGTEPALRTVVSQLPVAGLTGTLHDRFLRAPDHVAAGVARAKTGSLPSVSALAGTVVDRDGRLLVFVLLANKAGNPLDTRAALDRVVGRLYGCGCR